MFSKERHGCIDCDKDCRMCIVGRKVIRNLNTMFGDNWHSMPESEQQEVDEIGEMLLSYYHSEWRIVMNRYCPPPVTKKKYCIRQFSLLWWAGIVAALVSMYAIYIIAYALIS